MRPCLLRTAVIVLARLVAGCATMVQRITIFFGCCLGVFLTPGWHCELNASDMLRSIRAIFSHEQNCTERYTFHQPGRPHCSHIWKHRYSSACSEAQPVFCSSVPLLLMLKNWNMCSPRSGGRTFHKANSTTVLKRSRTFARRSFYRFWIGYKWWNVGKKAGNWRSFCSPKNARKPTSRFHRMAGNRFLSPMPITGSFFFPKGYPVHLSGDIQGFVQNCRFLASLPRFVFGNLLLIYVLSVESCISFEISA